MMGNRQRMMKVMLAVGLAMVLAGGLAAMQTSSTAAMAAMATTATGGACTSQEKTATEFADTMALQHWDAGKTVNKASVAAFGADRCFAAEPVPDDVWQRMQGKSYRENPYIGREQLRHVKVLHWDYDQQIHIGELVCNVAIAKDLVEIFRELYKHRYPIERMVLPDVYDADDEQQMRANNTSCFCYRVVAGHKTLSKHARGLAVDLNPLYNPYYKKHADGTRFVQPANAGAYCDRSKTFKYKIDRSDLAYRLFTQHGFGWGGNWKYSKDFQHFEK